LRPPGSGYTISTRTGPLAVLRPGAPPESAEDRRPAVPGSDSPLDEGPDQQHLADRDQTAADADQTGADLDQTLADGDQMHSQRDQAASDLDQASADADQAAVDALDQAATDAYARTRRARAWTTLERDITSKARSDAANVRDATAARRDRAAAERDEAAAARDELAAKLDAEVERLEKMPGHPGMSVLLRAVDDRKRAAASRARAAAQREAARLDREQAARDREEAARDRALAAAELALEGFDHLTGALRRRVGLAAIQREVDRTRRTGENLVVGFVDVDGLKEVNDAAGHAAGDHLLREIVRAIRRDLRSYDLVARYGGDEFVCALTGDMDAIRARFRQMAARFAQATDGASVTIGLAEVQPHETLEELLARADADLIALRGAGPG